MTRPFFMFCKMDLHKITMKTSINKRLVSFALNGINKQIIAADAAESFGAIALGNVVNTVTTTFVIFSGVPAAITARNAKNREVQNTSLLNDALFYQQAA